MKFNIPYAKDESLPSFAKIEEGFKTLASHDFSEKNFDEIKSIFLNALQLLPQFLAPQGKLDFPIFRTRIINDKSEDLSNPSTFSYPPSDKCPPGRCNLKNFPVFYASISEAIAIYELKKEKGVFLESGDIFYLSEWKTKNDSTNFCYSQFVFNEDVNLGELMKGLNRSMLTKLKRISQPYSEDKQKAFKHLMSELGKYFISDDYSISSFLAHYLLYDERDSKPVNADAISYPSIQGDLNTANFAIHPKFVDENMQLKIVKEIQFINRIDNGVSSSLIRIGIPDDKNFIKWYKPHFSPDEWSIENLELMFVNDPPNLKGDFFHHEIQKSIEDIVFYYLHENLDCTLDILSNVESEIKYGEELIKDLYINFSKKDVYLIVDNEKYYLETIKVVLKYKIMLREEELIGE